MTIIWLSNFNFFNYIDTGWSKQLGISPPPQIKPQPSITFCQWQYKGGITNARKEKCLITCFDDDVAKIISWLQFYYHRVVHMKLGISPPPGSILNHTHQCPIANNNTKDALKVKVTETIFILFIHHLAAASLAIQLHCLRAVHATGDISTPRMNVKLLPWQH